MRLHAWLDCSFPGCVLPEKMKNSVAKLHCQYCHESQGRVVVRGKVLGAELMLTNYPSGYIARALTYTDLYALHRDEMKEVLNK